MRVNKDGDDDGGIYIERSSRKLGASGLPQPIGPPP